MKQIDFHTHVVPLSLHDNGRRSDAFPILQRRSETEAAVMVRGSVFRMIDSRSWSVERRLTDMEDDQIDVQVLSPMPELLSHWLDVSEADDLCRIMNDEIASMIAAAPASFRGIGMVPMQQPELAAKRLEDVSRLGLLGIEIGTHINGLPLGHPTLDTVYAAAAERNLLIFVHPLHPVGMERIGDPKELAGIAIFPLETAMAVMSLLGSGVMQRFPKLRFLLSHGGGAATWIAPRVDFAYRETKLLQGRLNEPASRTLERFWYDTIVYDSAALRFLGDRVGTDRLVVGSDYPFPVRQKQPALFAQTAIPVANFSRNAEALSGSSAAFATNII